jgi:hypothetical protein
MVYQALLDASQTSNVLRRNARSANDRQGSQAFRNRRPRLDFRYAPLVTEIARRCNMSLRVKSRRRQPIGSWSASRVGFFLKTNTNVIHQAERTDLQ